MHSTPHTKRIPRKSVNRFLFVRFSLVQKLISNVKRWLKKYTSTVAFCPAKDTPQRPCQLIAIVHAGRSFLLFQPFAFTF